MHIAFLVSARRYFLFTELCAISWLSMHMRAIRCEIPSLHTHAHIHLWRFAHIPSYLLFPMLRLYLCLTCASLFPSLFLSLSFLPAVQFSFLCSFVLLFLPLCCLFTVQPVFNNFQDIIRKQGQDQ